MLGWEELACESGRVSDLYFRVRDDKKRRIPNAASPKYATVKYRDEDSFSFLTFCLGG